MALAGSLEIQILAGIAKLQSDMNSAVGIVTVASKSMEAAIGLATKAMGALGIAASVAGLAAFVKTAIDAE